MVLYRVAGFILLMLVAAGCRTGEPSVSAERPPDWYYELDIEKPVTSKGRSTIFRIRQGFRIYREGKALTLSPGGFGMGNDTPPPKPTELQPGGFWLRREPGRPWEISPDEPVSRRPTFRSVLDHGYGEVVSALGVDAVGPFGYPEITAERKVGDSWPVSMIVGTRHNKRRVAMVCTLQEGGDGRRIEFITADSSKQKGAWTIDAKGELVAYESEQMVISTPVGVPERTSISKVTVRKKWAAKPTPPPTARQAL